MLTAQQIEEAQHVSRPLTYRKVRRGCPYHSIRAGANDGSLDVPLRQQHGLDEGLPGRRGHAAGGGPTLLGAFRPRDLQEVLGHLHHLSGARCKVSGQWYVARRYKQ